MGFDLDTSTGVAQLLAAVRASELPPAEKNELRDLVMSYANSHEPSVKISLEQKITAHQLQPVATAAPAATQLPVHPFGATRPAPTMKPPAATAAGPTSAASTPTVPSTSPAQTPVVPAPEPIPASTPKESPAPQPQPQPEPESESESVQVPISTVPTVPETPKSNAVQPTPSANPAAASKPAPATPPPTTAPTPATSQPKPVDGTHLARIKEIKADVNARSGNPAHLIDATNGVGREYMTALLDAMKTLNSGASPATAMERLEAAYSAVLTSLDANATAPVVNSAVSQPPGTPSTANPSSAPAQPPVPNSVSQSASPAASVGSPAPLPTLESAAPAPAPAPEPVAAPTSPAPDNLPTAPATAAPAAPESSSAQPVPKTESQPVSAPQPVQAVPEIPATPAPAPTSPQAVPARGPKSVAEALETPHVPDPPRVTSPRGQDNLPQSKPVASLADSATAPHSPDDLPDPASLETASVTGDPLYTKEVDNGLNQLLAEWPLFKKSGLFGTGPKGLQHPLFIKVKDLQIPLLLAGRFEGATQEIKQSITDYMNGWRYEQGIVYEQGETFEHYLRRVIRHILDLQKG